MTRKLNFLKIIPRVGKEKSLALYERGVRSRKKFEKRQHEEPIKIEAYDQFKRDIYTPIKKFLLNF